MGPDIKLLYFAKIFKSYSSKDEKQHNNVLESLYGESQSTPMRWIYNGEHRYALRRLQANCILTFNLELI